MKFAGLAYRAHDPQWAWTPISGDGAAIHGGRFNPRGVPALYLALSVEGMFLEMGHGFAKRFSPLTTCTYDVDVDDVVDLRTDTDRNAVGIALDDMACAWEFDVGNGQRPASWRIYTDLVGAGASGVLVPSFAIGARLDHHNLVLWRWSDRLPHKVSVYDPSGALPKDRSSWQR